MMTDTELFWAARARAPHHGASSASVARLRAYLHEQLTLKPTPDNDAGDVAGRLLDAIEEYEFVKVGDYLTGDRGIPWNVLEVLDGFGERWRRAFGADRFAVDDATGEPDPGQEYDWVTEGGRSTDDGVLSYAPLMVVKVAMRPAGEEESMSDPTVSVMPDAVAEKTLQLGHDMKPAAGAYDETHACTRCTARAYPMPGRRSEWVGWATEFTCRESAAALSRSAT